MPNLKPAQEWIKQSDYDIDTAKDMLKSGRYIYTIFMCHLAVEKGLKALAVTKLKKEPPKTHDLLYLCKVINSDIPDELKISLQQLNELSVPTRYPDQLEKMIKIYGKDKAEALLKDSLEVLKWVKKNKNKL
jgi:HEPN domain-containing protein